jgi:two-component system alkaline phosphatase synthesis response regulator PhoP
MAGDFIGLRYRHANFAGMSMEGEKKRILLVEDEPALRTTLKLNFELEGYAVTTATTGPEALERMRGARFDLVVMDVMLPGMDGFTVVETVRLEGDRVPVLFLTARSTTGDRLRGLKAGDDHVAKPFELPELLLRVSNLLKRSQGEAPGQVPLVYSFGGNRIDFGSFEARCHDGTLHRLAQREVLLLRLLVDKAGEVVSREEILRKVWGYNVYPTTRTVDNFLVAFRKYFEPDPRAPKHFHSVRGVGYKFIP